MTSGTAKSRRLAIALATLACAAIAWPAASSAAGPTTITVAASTPTLADNCFPFGLGGAEMTIDWRPYVAFVYKNIPAFELKPKDVLAFDTSGAQNDANIELDIALAPTTANGSDQNAGAFTTVVNNSQTPLNPRGDTTVGNYDLQFIAQSGFSFTGGGLIIRFSNPSAAYVADTTCTANLDAGAATDTSGYFVKRAFSDVDGVAPWTFSEGEQVGEFRLTFLPSNTFSFGKLKRNKHRGTATLAVNVPGPGSLSLTGKGVKPQRTVGARASKAVGAAGAAKLRIAAKGKKKHKLNDRGKLKVGVDVTFTPSGGNPNTQTKRVKLVKKS